MRQILLPKWLWPLWLGCLVLAACGDDTDSDGPAVRELPALLAAHICPEVESCLDARSLHVLFGDDGCKGYVTAQGEDGDIPALLSAIDQGRVDYDASIVSACLDSLKGVGCAFATSRTFDSGACEQVFTGSVAIGDPCDVDEECEGDAFCNKGDACPGTCSKLLGPAERCVSDDQCEDGLSCSGQDEKACAAPAQEGDACDGDAGAECMPGLYCIGADADTGAAGTCKSAGDVFVGKAGDSCDFDSGELCKLGLSCVVKDIPTDGGDPTIECDKGVDSGADCNFGAPSQCPDDERCSADINAGELTGSCVPLPRTGEACVDEAASPPCAPGLHCDDRGVCRPLERLGLPCVSDQDCASKRCDEDECKRPEVCEL